MIYHKYSSRRGETCVNSRRKAIKIEERGRNLRVMREMRRGSSRRVGWRDQLTRERERREDWLESIGQLKTRRRINHADRWWVRLIPFNYFHWWIWDLLIVIELFISVTFTLRCSLMKKSKCAFTTIESFLLSLFASFFIRWCYNFISRQFGHRLFYFRSNIILLQSLFVFAQ